jgi:hypothetical protein
MAEGLSVPDGTDGGTPVDVQAGKADFDRMMAKAASGESELPEIAAPPKRPVDTTDPGYTPNPKPKRGRPTKAERARTTDAPPPVSKDKPLPPKDFRGDLNAVGDGLWLGLSSIPVTSPYAALVHANQPGIVAAVNQGAQVNTGMRNYVEKLTSGGGNAWMLQLGLIGVNIAMQGLQLARDPELRRQLAEANTAQVQAYVEAVTGAVQEAA